MTDKKRSILKTEYFDSLVDQIVSFYEEQAGFEVADQFLYTVEKALSRITENNFCGSRYIPPEAFLALRQLEYRRILLNSFSPFPYTIYYEIKDEYIIIQSLYHQSRHQEKTLVKGLLKP